MFNLGLSEIIILLIVFSPVAIGVTLWIGASRRARARRNAPPPAR